MSTKACMGHWSNGRTLFSSALVRDVCIPCFGNIHKYIAEIFTQAEEQRS